MAEASYPETPPALNSKNLNLLFAFHAAATTLQQAARSEAQVLAAFGENLDGLDLGGMICLLDEAGERWSVRAASLPQLSQIEAETGVKVVGFDFPTSQADLCRKVMESGVAYSIADVSAFLGEIFGGKASPEQPAAASGETALRGVLAPLKMGGTVRGLLYLQGRELADEDRAIVELFGDHVSIALENARLIARLSDNEENLRELIEAIPDTVCIKDGIGRWLSANQAMLRLFHISDFDYRGKSDRELAEYQPQFQGVLKVCSQSDEAAWQKRALFRNEEVILYEDGTEQSFDVVKVPLFNLDGSRNRLLVVGREITARKKMEKDLLQRADELSGLYSLSIDINSVQDLQELLEKVVERAVALLGSSGGGLYICDARRRTAKLVVSYNTREDYRGVVLNYGEGAAGRVAESGEPLVIDDYRKWSGRASVYEDQQPFTAVIAVPIIWQEQVIGVLDIIDDASNRLFSTSDLELLTLFANQAAVAISNARLLDAERHRRQEAEMLGKAAAVLTSSLDLDQVLGSILGHLEEVVPYDSAAVFLLEDEQLKIVAAKGFAQLDQVIGSVFPGNDDLFSEIKSRKGPVILDDAQNSPQYHRWEGTDYVRGWMGVPLIVRGEVIGYVTLDSSELRAYDSEAAALAEAFANQAASAIQNARLFKAARTQLLLAQTLQDVGALLTSQLSLQEVLESILDLLGRVVRYDCASIQLLDEYGFLEMAAGRGFSDYENVQKVVHELSAPLMQSKWKEQTRVMVIRDTQNDPLWIPYPGMDYIRSWIGAPLLVKGRFIGSLNVDNRIPGAYTPEDGETVMAFANQAAIAIENARLFEAERAARARSEALRDAVRNISSSLSLHEVLQAVLEQLGRVLTFDSGNVMLVEGDHLEIKVWQGYDAFVEPQLLDSVHYKMDSEIYCSQVVRSGQPLTLKNVQQQPGWQVYEVSKHVNSWLGVPLFVREECIGLFSLDRTGNQGFSEEEILLTQSFAWHASTAIENARLFEAEGKRAAELEAVRQASLSLTASLELPEVLDAILSHVLQLLPDSQNSHIFLYYPEKDRLTFGAALWADGRRGQPIAMPRSHGITHTVARSGDVVVVPDMRNHPLYEGTPEDWNGAIIGLPLKIGQRVVGVMNVSYQQARTFSASELRLLRLLGDQAAIAIENARLFEQAAIEQRHLSLLYDVGRELATSLNPDEILQRAITLTCQALEGLVGQAYLYIPEEDQLSLRAIYGGSESSLEEVNTFLRTHPGIGLVRWVYQKALPANVANVQDDDRWYYLKGIDDEVQSAISAPIKVGERVLGVLSVLHPQAGAFTNDHLDLLQAICQEVGLALSNATRYEQVQRRLTEITIIQSLTQTFNRRLELQELLNEVAAQLAERLGYPQVEIFMLEGDHLVQRAYHGAAPQLKLLSLNQGIVGRVARTGQVALALDVSLDPDYQECVGRTVAELAVPIFRGRTVVGVINIETDIPGKLSAQDRDLMQVLAGQISIALENAVLYERVRLHAEDLEHTVAQRTAELVELYELSQKIGYTLSYNDLFALLLSHLRKAINSDVVMGALLTDGNRLIALESVRPLGPGAMTRLRGYWQEVLRQQGYKIKEFESLPLEVESGRAIQADAPPLDEVDSLVQVPIVVDGKTVGVLIAGCQACAAFTDDQLRVLDTFGNQAAVALQRLAAMLAAEQKRLEGLVEHLPVGVLLLDHESRLLLANPIGRGILDLLKAGELSSVLENLGPVWVSDLIERHAEMLPLEIQLDSVPRRIFEAQARPVGMEKNRWVVTLREVTQERENQERIQMQERLATVGQLAAGIAHDFNNIMAAILVYADLLTDDPNMPAISRERLGIIKQQVERAASLIRQILDFSRRSIMEASTLDLLPFIKELDKMLRRVMPETIALELVYQQGSYLVHADPTRLQQALMNLALNSRDAMVEGGVLRFELGSMLLSAGEKPPIADMPPGEWIRLSVEDTGEGISAENIPHIFEPFFTTKPVGQGTGLGLAQVYGIIKQHNGYLDFESQPGVGTRFRIFLPAYTEKHSATDLFESSAAFDGFGKTVLVVEDDGVTRDALTALLETYNYRVLAARNGVEALELLGANEYSVDLVVSDVVMPRMGGFPLYRTLQERWPQVKVLFITGHPMEEESQAILERGAVHWLQKPFSVQDFHHAIQVLMASKE